jgi:peptidoglycan/xylan/chitin deacetylase (PgdA/CDA1 family)
LSLNSKADENNTKQYSNDEGVLSIMYHRFNENKYPSTNIQMEVFYEHIKLIKDSNYQFLELNNFIENFDKAKKQKKILITIDDGFISFYENAWPFLKKNKIPFILFVSTDPIGKNGYMTWDQIKEIEKENFAAIGHHSHSHEYLIDKSNSEFISDIEKANKLFLKNIGYIPKIFSYPFGEYSEFMRDYISKNFDFAFGQHSGVIDLNKEKFELPRFPINENYGKLDRFKSIINTFPLEYKKIIPLEKKLNKENNPPNFQVEFFNDQQNIKNINCFSNEGDIWKKSNIKINNNILTIKFREPFKPRRGRINCSLNDNGKWRWFGTQFVIKKN